MKQMSFNKYLVVIALAFTLTLAMPALNVSAFSASPYAPSFRSSTWHYTFRNGTIFYDPNSCVANTNNYWNCNNPELILNITGRTTGSHPVIFTSVFYGDNAAGEISWEFSNALTAHFVWHSYLAKCGSQGAGPVCKLYPNTKVQSGSFTISQTNRNVNIKVIYQNFLA
jgi:hypothetical protein